MDKYSFYMALSALLGLAGSLLGSELQSKRNRENFDYMQQVNSPAAQIARFRQAGINPAMMMLNPTVSSGNASAPPDSPDYNAFLNTGLNSALEFSMLGSQIRKVNAEADAQQAAADEARSRTELNESDIKFRDALNAGNLYMLSAQYQHELSNKLLTDEEVKKTHQEYENLVKEADVIEANKSLIEANAKKVDKESALLDIEKDLRVRLADKQIQVNDQQIRTLAAQAYEFAVNAQKADVEKSILDVQNKFAERMASANYQEAQNRARTSTHQEKYQKALAASAEMQNERTKAGQGFATFTPIAVTREWFSTIGSIFGGISSAAVQMAK